jgi:hypothetical protein
VVAVCGAPIAVYLLQLLVAAALCAAFALLFVPAFLQHLRLYEGHLADPRLLGAVTCSPPTPALLDSDAYCRDLLEASNGGNVDVSALSGNDAAACLVLQRTHCPLPSWALMADLLGTSLLGLGLVCTLLLTAGGGSQQSLQGRLKSRLDMRVPTARAFTVQVTNPPAGASDPSEWFQFFNRRGKAKVQNVTVTYRNKLLVDLVLQKRQLLRRFSADDISSRGLLHKSELTKSEALLLGSLSCSPLLALCRVLRLTDEGRDVLHMRDLCATNKAILAFMPKLSPEKEAEKEKEREGAGGGVTGAAGAAGASAQLCSVFVTFEQQAAREQCVLSTRRFRGVHSLALRR